ncbi:zinc finger protein 595-like [Mercenaria mercenaria]|uniref:zinc finger protein 595-like n=1 Tax=Mercenaria mercenaria TaxID=6596 RepID=UPI00234F4F0E|nr:zinc finger protein 595-like [Mercenaria mercenaria]XP_045196374.2 zinc finger protein 595-like [Mercenaria mercenaria]XP_053396905.1 zinc finger protein 595-like [Mercenaria mercenaria]
MSALPSDLIAMKDSPTYMPILRSVLKSQIQFLVEQLSGAGEETLILSANVNDGVVDQLGSEPGKMFANVYDDFKSEFLEFCQKRRGKRKPESPQKTPIDVKRGRPSPAVLALPKASVVTQKIQAVKSPSNVPKVSSARIIINQKPASTPGSQFLTSQPDIEGLEESEEGYGEIEDTGLDYEELEDVEEWQDESADMPSSSEGHSSSSKVKTAKVVPKENTATQRLKRRKFPCSDCGKSYGTRWALRVHSLRHGEKKFSCEKCGKMFFTITELRQHINHVHFEGERRPGIKFACEFCDQRYARKENLMNHIKIKHENAKKSYICDICNKAFHFRHILSVHKLRHGEKKFRCCQCSKMFFTNTELKQHEKNSHTEKPPAEEKEKDSSVNFEKMFSKAMSCKDCGKLFIRGDALKLHMLSHTGENPHTCVVCGQGYRKKRSYIIHLKNKHPEEYAEMDEI